MTTRKYDLEAIRCRIQEDGPEPGFHISGPELAPHASLPEGEHILILAECMCPCC
jgi:hypothetical protein